MYGWIYGLTGGGGWGVRHHPHLFWVKSIPHYFKVILSLTNRFHVAVRLFSNRSQMTSKCGKNNEVAHEPQAECVTDVFTTF